MSRAADFDGTEYLTAQGVWWLPGKDGTPVQGTLTFDRAAGGVLTLNGALDVWQDHAPIEQTPDGGTSLTLTRAVMERSGTYPKILGTAGNESYTLEDCFQTSLRGAVFGPPHEQTVIVNRVFKGAGFDGDEKVTATSLEVHMAYLDAWAIQDSVTEEHTYPQDTTTPASIRLIAVDCPDRTATLDNGMTLSLLFDHGVRGNKPTERTIWQDHRLRVHTETPVPINDLIDVLSDAQDLISLATGRNAEFLQLRAHHPDLTVTLPGGVTYPETFRMYARWSIRDTAKTPGRLKTGDMYFTLDDLGGIDGLTRWMNVAADLRSPLGRAMSARGATSMPVSDRLLNYTAALEGIDRIRNPNLDRDKLDARLRRLSTTAGLALASLVGNPNAWSGAVAFYRNDIAHHLGRRADTPTSVTHFLGESVYWAFVLTMLLEAKAPQTVIDQITANEKLKWLEPKVRAIVNEHSQRGAKTSRAPSR